ncbi:MAG: hypothetical protein M1820_003582 [Bogoriella megaspora]|nr:MAG: hypothetical protein M1820_003582 [Bogoriella megaspora]
MSGVEVVGTISASIDLAARIADLVRRFTEARKRITAIANDVSLLQSILKQLKEVLQPDPNAGYTAVRLTNEGLRNSLTAVKKCRRIFSKIWEGLDQVTNHSKTKKRLDGGGVLTIDWLSRTFWIFKQDTIAELRNELKASKEDVMLTLSVNQLALAKQPSQLHPLDQRELDKLRVMVGLLVNAQQTKPEISPPKPPKVPNLPKPFEGQVVTNSFAATTADGPLGDRDPDSTASVSIPPFPRFRFDRVSRKLVRPAVLDTHGIKWINDPFVHGHILLFADITDQKLQELVQYNKTPPPLPAADRRPASAVLESDVEEEAENEVEYESEYDTESALDAKRKDAPKLWNVLSPSREKYIPPPPPPPPTALYGTLQPLLSRPNVDLDTEEAERRHKQELEEWKRAKEREVKKKEEDPAWEYMRKAHEIDSARPSDSDPREKEAEKVKKAEEERRRYLEELQRKEAEEAAARKTSETSFKDRMATSNKPASLPPTGLGGMRQHDRPMRHSDVLVEDERPMRYSDVLVVDERPDSDEDENEHDDEDVVEDLIRRWTKPVATPKASQETKIQGIPPPAEPSARIAQKSPSSPQNYNVVEHVPTIPTRPPRVPTIPVRPQRSASISKPSVQCEHVFQKGENMYECRTCGAKELTVFCASCFRATDHEGHDFKKRKSKSSESYCDCGHAGSVKREMKCGIHGTSRPD